VIDKICKKLPESVQNSCDDFVETYGSALVAILVEGIDPSQVKMTNVDITSIFKFLLLIHKFYDDRFAQCCTYVHLLYYLIFGSKHQRK
jgi:hypothetical protein